MSKTQSETQMIQTEYGVYVPKAYNPVTERMTSVAPSIIERAIVAAMALVRQLEHKPAGKSMIHHATPAQ